MFKNIIRRTLLIGGLVLTPQLFAASLPNDHLRVHLNFEDEGRLEHNLYDGINPQIIDQVDQVPSISKHGVSFDDIHDYLLLPEPFKSVDQTNQMTVSFWMNLPELPLRGTEVIGGTEKSKSDGTFAYAVTPAGKSLFYLNTKKIYFPSLVSADEWTHIALTYDSSSNEIKLYMNGELQVSDAFPDDVEPININVDQDLYVGQGRFVSGYNFFNGSLDDLKIYDQALTEQQVKLLSTHSVYVSPEAKADDNLNQGTKSQPFHSIQNAIEFAAARDIYNVRVAEGTFDENIHLHSGLYLGRDHLHLQGGHKLGSWEPKGNNSVIKPTSTHQTTVISARGHQWGSIIEGFDFIANDAQGQLASSVAVRLDSVVGDLTFLRNNIFAGNGRIGADGINGSNGADGGRGGDALNYNIAIGGHGCTRGGNSGEIVDPNRRGNGDPASPGSASSHISGVVFKNTQIFDWQASNSYTAGNGGCGKAGSGGNSTFCLVSVLPPLAFSLHGGGGGGSGWGGISGTPGHGGGGSIGIVAFQTDGVIFLDNTITTTAGGNGGIGSDLWSEGGKGGLGGIGQFCWSGAQSGAAAYSGGRGSWSGSGNGGHSIGLMNIESQLNWDSSRNTVSLGSAGTGGAHRYGSNFAGKDGITQEIYDCYNRGNLNSLTGGKLVCN